MTKFISKLKAVKWKHYVNYIGVALAMLVFTLVTLLGEPKSSTLYLLENITMNIILAVSLSLVVGFLGELSLGHAGFMCIGAYIGGKLSSLLSAGALGDGIVNLIISMLVGAIAAGAFGFVIGLPALRLKGDYLAIVTLAFGEIVRTIFQNSSEKSFGGPMGIKTPRFDKHYLFIIGFVLVLITLFVVQNVIRSKHGRAITAIRDNEIAARATGINVTKYKLLGFIISAAFAGVAGVFYSFANFNVRPVTFDYNYSIEMLVMVVLGGMGNVSGAIISATLITILNTELQTVLSGDLAVLKDIIYSLVLIVIVIYNNAPKLKAFRDKYNPKAILHRVMMRRRDAGYVVDDAARWDVIPTKIDMDEVLSTDLNVTESTLKPDKEEKP
ncbi:MAG: branched-chain amino acid ABC transporter permease [Clostridia bacterium]|nr:branched-chain amino acid ABC transporter permease [Clostridia bacterium]MBR3680952.1 branched-chain amino acid ABC transporter permease [Clostridia bacterium]